MDIETIKRASSLYAKVTDFSDSYREFRRATQPELDLTRSDHRGALLSWLNSWGCRFKRSDHPLASRGILSWYEGWATRLPERKQHLRRLCEREPDDLAWSYETLRHETASYQVRESGRVKRRIGPTGASKILFALRPRVAVPWDRAMQVHFGYRCGSAYGYRAFLTLIQKDLVHLERQCKALGIRPRDLPSQLGRPDATVPQLVEEYYWLTITKELEV